MMTPELAMALTIERMKCEICEEAATGRIPKTGRRFSQLHDYIDANELGGFCEECWPDVLDQLLGGPEDDDDAETLFTSKGTAFMNEAQTAIDMWLQAGGLT
jgi:hypothetical protein